MAAPKDLTAGIMTDGAPFFFYQCQMFYEFGLQIRRKRICLECVLGCVLYFCFIPSQIQDMRTSTKHVQSYSVCQVDDRRGVGLKRVALTSLF